MSTSQSETKKFSDIRGPSHYSLHIRYIPAGEPNGPAHHILLVCDGCNAEWEATQHKILRSDNATNIAVNHRLECKHLNKE